MTSASVTQYSDIQRNIGVHAYKSVHMLAFVYKGKHVNTLCVQQAPISSQDIVMTLECCVRFMCVRGLPWANQRSGVKQRRLYSDAGWSCFHTHLGTQVCACLGVCLHESLSICVHSVLSMPVCICVTKLKEGLGAGCVQQRSDVAQNRSQSNAVSD